VSTGHVTASDIERARQRRLPPSALVSVARHLAACEPCRTLASATVDLNEIKAALAIQIGDSDEDHVPEADVHAYVDGRLDPARYDEVGQHVLACPLCAAEVENLQVFSAEAPARRAAEGRRPYLALGAAAAVICAIAASLILAWMSRAPAATTLVRLTDSPGDITLDDAGRVSGVEGVSTTQLDAIRQALSSGTLALPLVAQSKRIGTLMGSETANPFRLLGPVGSAVLEDRPLLRWSPAADAAGYRVSIEDVTTGEVRTTPLLGEREWRVDVALARGRTYRWQVAASINGIEVVAPPPTAPPATFTVIDESTFATLSRIPASHLVRGVLYANAGLLDDAERELEALSALNPDTEVATRLLRQVQEARASSGA
jgi:hypothetical protein